MHLLCSNWFDYAFGVKTINISNIVPIYLSNTCVKKKTDSNCFSLANIYSIMAIFNAKWILLIINQIPDEAEHHTLDLIWSKSNQIHKHICCTYIYIFFIKIFESVWLIEVGTDFCYIFTHRNIASKSLKRFTIMGGGGGVSPQPPPVCSIHLDDATAASGQRRQCAHHTPATGWEERVIEPITCMGIIRRPWLIRASGGNLARTPGLHPYFFKTSAMGFFMTTESQDLGLMSHPKCAF